MKNILAALLLCLTITATTPAAHATVVNRDQANEYYATCVSRKAPGARPESMAALCACTSAQLMSKMTVEELTLANENSIGSQAAQHKLLLEVYAPCTEVVAADMIDFECVSNKKLDELNEGFDIPKICACAAQKSADWYQGKAKAFMAEILAKNSDVANPAGALMAHPLMKSQISGNMIACSATPPAAVETPQTGTDPAAP